MANIRFLFLSALLSIPLCVWAAKKPQIIEQDEKICVSPEACSRTQSTKDSEISEKVQQSRPGAGSAKGPKSVVWTSLPQAEKSSKVSIGESERWVDAGSVPSLEKGSNLGTLKSKRDFRSKSVKARSARMIRVKRSNKKGLRDLKKQGVLDKASPSMELVAYGNEDSAETQTLDKEELKRLLEEALRKKKLSPVK